MFPDVSGTETVSNVTLIPQVALSKLEPITWFS